MDERDTGAIVMVAFTMLQEAIEQLLDDGVLSDDAFIGIFSRTSASLQEDAKDAAATGAQVHAADLAEFSLRGAQAKLAGRRAGSRH